MNFTCFFLFTWRIIDMLKQIGLSTLLLMSQFSISGTMYAQDKKTPKIKFINQTQPTLKTSGKGAIIKDYFKANITKCRLCFFKRL